MAKALPVEGPQEVADPVGLPGGSPHVDWARHYLPDLVYGANDGVITTFAVLTGVAGAALPVRTALILGAANLLADGFSMGASNFLSIRSRESVREAHGLPPDERHPLRHATATWVAFVIAGAIPLLLQSVFPVGSRFPLTVIGTLLALFIIGSLRSTVTPIRWWLAGGEMLGVGAAAALVSYVVGALVAAVI